MFVKQSQEGRSSPKPNMDMKAYSYSGNTDYAPVKNKNRTHKATPKVVEKVLEHSHVHVTSNTYVLTVNQYKKFEECTTTTVEPADTMKRAAQRHQTLVTSK